MDLTNLYWDLVVAKGRVNGLSDVCWNENVITAPQQSFYDAAAFTLLSTIHICRMDCASFVLRSFSALLAPKIPSQRRPLKWCVFFICINHLYHWMTLKITLEPNLTPPTGDVECVMISHVGLAWSKHLLAVCFSRPLLRLFIYQSLYPSLNNSPSLSSSFSGPEHSFSQSLPSRKSAAICSNRPPPGIWTRWDWRGSGSLRARMQCKHLEVAIHAAYSTNSLTCEECPRQRWSHGPPTRLSFNS